LGVYYFVTFIRFSPKQSPTLPGSTLQHFQGISLIMGITTILALTLNTMKAAEVIGIMGVIFCVAMFASPLAALKSVLATKSAKSIPLPFTLAAVVNCFLWSVVGVMDMKDFNIYAPNLLGLFFGLVQLTLKVIYKNARDHRETPPHSPSDSISEPLLEAV
jgi:solute carrier family 50 protein (sugar transporter)